ncbi:MAG: AAA family ATPase [Nocardioides sp.]
MDVFVLVGGWPGSGKTTLSRSVALALGLACLGKDEAKEALMDALGAPEDLPASRDLGVAAVHAVLRLARSCPGAVVDSTWYPYARPLALALPGACVEVRCVLPRDLARSRYASRARDPRHLDAQRSPHELWAVPVAPLGVGPLVEVDTSGPVDVPTLARSILDLVPAGPGQGLTTPCSDS